MTTTIDAKRLRQISEQAIRAIGEENADVALMALINAAVMIIQAITPGTPTSAALDHLAHTAKEIAKAERGAAGNG